MNIKQIDFLSPKISLFYKGKKSHSSNVGAVMTILMVLLSGLYIFYLLYNILHHNISNFMFYKNYLDDAGHYIFNDTGGIFHYFQIYNYQKQEFSQFNTKYIRVFMSRLLYKNYPHSLSENEHWVYDICRDGLDNKNIPKDVFKETNSFSKGVCLRYYYDNEKKKYYPIEDKENFKYPYLIHGSGRNDNLLLETVIEKCNNKSIITDLLGPCGDDNEIDDYLNIHKAIFFQLLEKQLDTENYSKSLYQYIYSISGSLDSINVPVNNVNLMPFYIEIKKGIFLPETERIITYIFDDNRKTTFENSIDKNLLAIFDYWLINSCQVIKGGYNNLYDVLPNIGGIIQLIYYIFFSFNYLYNKYMILQDCNKLFFKMYNKETEDKDKEIIQVKKLFFNYVNSIREEIKLKRLKAQLKRKVKFEKINNLSIIEFKENIKNTEKKIKTEINLNSNLINNLNNDDNNNSNILSNSNDLIMNLPKVNIVKNKTNIDIIKNKKKTLYFRNKFKPNEKTTKKMDELTINKNNKLNFLYYQFTYQIQDFFYHKNNEFKVEPLNENIISQFISFSNYLLSIFGNNNKKRVFFILSKFREKILGEENLFRTKIYLYHLEKYFNIREMQKSDILELYDN